MKPIDDTDFHCCPFCGDKPVTYFTEPHIHGLQFVPDSTGYYWAECVKCDYHRGYEDLDELKKQWNKRLNQNGWIKCEERLPDVKAGYFLTCDKNKEIAISFFEYSEWFNDKLDPIYWSEIPELPEDY